MAIRVAKETLDFKALAVMPNGMKVNSPFKCKAF